MTTQQNEVNVWRFSEVKTASIEKLESSLEKQIPEKAAKIDQFILQNYDKMPR